MSKKYTPEEAAKAVLKKAEEMLKSSKLMKQAPTQDSTIAMKEKTVSTPDTVQASGIEQHASTEKENGNPAWGTEPGCHKLSKFMGRREEKSKAKSTPAPAPAAPKEGVK